MMWEMNNTAGPLQLWKSDAAEDGGKDAIYSVRRRYQYFNRMKGAFFETGHRVSSSAI